MTRVARRKLLYAVSLLALLGLGLYVATVSQAALVGYVVLLLIPGRIGGYLYRDFYAGSFRLHRGDPAGALERYRAFQARLERAPYLQRHPWLCGGWLVYSSSWEAMARHNEGLALAQLGATDEAEAAFLEASELDAGYAKPRLALAELYLGRDPESREGARQLAEAWRLGLRGGLSDALASVGAAALARLEGGDRG